MTQSKANQFYLLLVFCLLSVFVYFLAPILTPFLTGILLAYLANPLVNQLQKLKIPRVISVTIVFLSLFLMLFLLVLLLIPVIQKQMAALTDVIPKSVDWIQNTIVPWLTDQFGVSEEFVNIDTLKSLLASNWSKAGGAANWLFKTAMHSGMTVLEWLTNLILIPVVTFYLLCDWKVLIKGLRNLIPRQKEPTVVRLTKECDEVLSSFFRGQLLVMIALGSIYSVGLTLVGLQVGLIIGLISGLVSIVPYLGFIVGIITASIAAFVQFNSLSHVVVVWLIFGVGHMIDHALLTPYLVGNRIGLHPVAVIFAILAGGCLFGFLGILLALPVAAVIMVWVRHWHKQYRKSELYKAE